MIDISAFQNPTRLYSATEVFSNNSLDLDSSGLYGFWFRALPGVPDTECQIHDEYFLFYVGIADGQTIKSRFHKHYKETSSVSTLRMSVGCLLEMPLQLAGKMSHRFVDEDGLSDWLDKNAFVTWYTCAKPRIYEKSLLQSHSFPINLKGNEHHPFYVPLMALRKAARVQATSSR